MIATLLALAAASVAGAYEISSPLAPSIAAEPQEVSETARFDAAKLVPEPLVRHYVEYRNLQDEAAAKGEGAPSVRDGEYRSASGRMAELEGIFRKAVPENRKNLGLLLSQSDPPDRVMVCLLLGYDSDRGGAAVLLLAALNDSRHRIHEEAARTLYALASDPAVAIPAERLVLLLSHNSFGCQSRGVAALSALAARAGSTRPADAGGSLTAEREESAALIRLLLSPHPGVRRPALALLRRLSGERFELDPAPWMKWHERKFGSKLPRTVADRVAVQVRAVPAGSALLPMLYLDERKCRHTDELQGRIKSWQIQASRGEGKPRTVVFVVARPDLSIEFLSDLRKRALQCGVSEVVVYPRGEWDVDGRFAFDPAVARGATLDEWAVVAFGDYRDAVSRAASSDKGITLRIRQGEWWTDGEPGTFEQRFRAYATEKKAELLTHLRYGAPMQRELAACLLGWCGEKRAVYPELLREIKTDAAAHGVHGWIGWHLAAWAGLPGILIPAELALELARHDDVGCRARAVKLAERLVETAALPLAAADRKTLAKAVALAAKSGAGDWKERGAALLEKLAGKKPPEDSAAWGAFAETI